MNWKRRREASCSKILVEAGAEVDVDTPLAIIADADEQAVIPDMPSSSQASPG